MARWKLGALMTDNSYQNWHQTEESKDGDLTVRAPGPHFQSIREWAQENDIADIFDAIALTFGFTENFTIIGNLYRELSSPESTSILAQWSENSYINHLSRLSAAYSQSPEISNAFAGFPRRPSRSSTKQTLRNAGADISQTHFLLEMIVQPLVLSGPDSADRRRRAFRIWLIVQALERAVEHNCPFDSQIQQIASALSLPGDDTKWEVIDTVLHRSTRAYPAEECSYPQFTQTIRYAATQLKILPKFSENRKQKPLLDAIALVAGGHINAIRQNHQFAPFQPSLTGLLAQTDSAVILDKHRNEPQVLAFYDNESDTADEEGLEQLLLFNVEPKETPEQQRLSGRSVLMQTAELSHYLPWSWDKPLPPEKEHLEKWLDQTLSHSALGERFGAALVWLALRLGRSLEFVLEFEITDETGDEWSISTDLQTAHRNSPKRHSSWLPDQADKALIEPFETSLCIELPGLIQDILREAKRIFPGAPLLRGLWSRIGVIKLESWFKKHSRRCFPRLSSAKLGNAESQQVFEAFGDHSLARLISSHPSSALPAACGYANWDIRQIQSGFNLPIQTKSNSANRVNLLGSLLAPIESVLKSEIQHGTTKLLESSRGDPITFHNYFAQYTVTALYAATGCRHLSEPFESIAHFCQEPPAVFINDKSDDGLHCGRMVPLANDALTLFNAYCNHLRSFASDLEHSHPRLSSRIEQMLNGSSTTLPLFFLLDPSGFWHPLNDDSTPGAELFRWELPRNLFRHRFSQQLNRRGVNPEVIDGWMGHGERSATTYNDHSARCWKADVARHQQQLNDCFEELGFISELPYASLTTIDLQSAPTEPGYSEPQIFGQAKRHRDRMKARNQARSQARKDLNLFLSVNPLEEGAQLTQTYVNDLVRQMLLRENGLPHPRAAIRMEVLVQWLESRGPNARRFIRHRLARVESERSLFRGSCPRAVQVMPMLQQWASQTRQGIRQAQVSKSNGLALGAVLLAIDKRISYLQLLEDVIQGRNYRVIQHNDHVYFEYNEALKPEDFDQPVQRHQIDHTIGRLLAKGLGIKDTKDLATARCPKPLRSLADILRTAPPHGPLNSDELSLAQLIKSLHQLVEQANLVDLPGLVAGALSERNPPSSVCFYDYLRLKEGIRYSTPSHPAGGPALELDSRPHIVSMTPGNYPDEFYDSAKSFIFGLQNLLNTYTKSRSTLMAKEVEQYCRTHAHEVSSAIFLLGRWVAYRIRNGKAASHRAHTPYARNSLKRYLAALSPAFSGLASRTDLLTMTEDEVTELCDNMLSQCAEKQKDLHYFSARLVEFFDWACECGVSSPDWDELSLGSSQRSVRPRLFSEAEYFQALELLLRANAEHAERGPLSAFVLLLAFRFGLRAQEAIGLLRSDWCQSGQMTWVLVQSNKIRTLKNARNSRRAVPLMFQLSPLEQTIIQTILTQHTIQAAGDGNVPILCDTEKALTRHARSLAPDIARVLKTVTGNRKMSLHQARHVFCNVLIAALFEIDSPLAENLCPSADHTAIRSIMLGTQELPSRRCAMAIGRALGHQTPRTQLRSYNHLLTEWADSLTPLSSHYASEVANAIKTNEWPVEPQPQPGSHPTVFSRTEKLSPKTIAEGLRLMALGYNTDIVEQLLRLEPGEFTGVEEFVDRINESIRFKVFDPTRGKKAYVYGQDLPRHILKSRPADFWQRLLQIAEKLPPSDGIDFNRPLPSLEQASNLVGRNGHILMNMPEEANLLRLMVNSLNLPKKNYHAVVKSKPANRHRATRLLNVGQFQETTQSSIQLDTFNENYGVAYNRGRSYAGLVVAKPAVGPIHDNIELALFFTTIAAAYCPREITPSPVCWCLGGQSSWKNSGSFDEISSSSTSVTTDLDRPTEGCRNAKNSTI